jgi:hypothetical protein
MNNLVDLMNATGTTPIELSKGTGIPISNVRRLMTLDDLSGIYKTTQKKLADYFEITVNQLINGGTKMKTKILEAEIMKHAEALAVALRKYTSDSVHTSICVFTRDEPDDNGNIPDYCDVTSYRLDDKSGELVCVIGKQFLFYYGEEGIAKVEPFSRNGVIDNDSPC